MKENPTLVTSGLRFPEGPIAMPDGTIILVEIERATLTRVLSDGSTEVIAQIGGGPNGAAIGPGGHCYICNNGGFDWIERSGRIFPGDQAEDYQGGRIERVNLEKMKSRSKLADKRLSDLQGRLQTLELGDAACTRIFTELGSIYEGQGNPAAIT
jgi:sugar lactone lactonase YvrE